MEFNSSVSYDCAEEETYFEWNRTMEEYNITCQPGGTWDVPKIWPQCLACEYHQTVIIYFNILLPAVNCSDPPVKPGAGTWEWSGDYAYDTAITYTCGPIGNFQTSEDTLYEELVAVCGWNKSWVPNTLDTCTATACQEIPFPPKQIGLVYVPDEKNNITLASEFSQYNPSLPLDMKFSGPDFCGDNKRRMMVVGKIPADSQEMPEIVFLGAGTDEAYHLRLDAASEFVEVWAVVQNVTIARARTDGTSVDMDEPFTLM